MPVDYEREPDEITSTILRYCLSNKERALAIFNGAEFEPTEEMIIGKVAHCLLLEPDKFEDNFIVFGSVRRGKAYEELNLTTEKTIIKESTYQKALYMNQALIKQLDKPELAEVKKVLETGIKEKKIKYQETDGTKFSITPDAYNEDYLLEYKTTSLEYPSKEAWVRTISETNLKHQLALYYSILIKTNKEPKKGVFHLVQSKTPPYIANCFFFTKPFLKEILLDLDFVIRDALDILQSSKTVVHTLDLQDLEKIRLAENELQLRRAYRTNY